MYERQRKAWEALELDKFHYDPHDNLKIASNHLSLTARLWNKGKNRTNLEARKVLLHCLKKMNDLKRRVRLGLWL